MENENKNQVLTEVQSYIQSEYDIARIKVTRRASIMSGALLMVISVMFLAFLMIIAFAVGGTLGLMQIMPAWAVFLAIGGILLLLIVLMLLCRKFIFINPMVKALSDNDSLDDLETEAIRAEGNAALQRERLGNRVTAVQTAIDDYARLFKMLVRMISRLF